MKFAKVCFAIAGVYGVLVLTPMYFVFDRVGRLTPPAVTHPEYYYGFVTLAMVWQVVFLMIARAPARLRPMMIPAVLEKASWFIVVVALYSEHRAGANLLLSACVDAVLGVLFLVAFFRTRSAPAQ